MRKAIVYCIFNLLFFAFLFGGFLCVNFFRQLKLISNQSVENIEILKGFDDLPESAKSQAISQISSSLHQYSEIIEKSNFISIVICLLALSVILYFILEYNRFNGVCYWFVHEMRSSFKKKPFFFGWVLVLCGLGALLNACALSTWMSIDAVIHIDYSRVFDREKIEMLVDLLKESQNFAALSYYIMSLLLIIQGVYLIFWNKNEIGAGQSPGIKTHLKK